MAEVDPNVWTVKDAAEAAEDADGREDAKMIAEFASAIATASLFVDHMNGGWSFDLARPIQSEDIEFEFKESLAQYVLSAYSGMGVKPGTLSAVEDWIEQTFENAARVVLNADQFDPSTSSAIGRILITEFKVNRLVAFGGSGPSGDLQHNQLDQTTWHDLLFPLNAIPAAYHTSARAAAGEPVPYVGSVGNGALLLLHRGQKEPPFTIPMDEDMVSIAAAVLMLAHRVRQFVLKYKGELFRPFGAAGVDPRKILKEGPEKESEKDLIELSYYLALLLTTDRGNFDDVNESVRMSAPDFHGSPGRPADRSRVNSDLISNLGALTQAPMILGAVSANGMPPLPTLGASEELNFLMLVTAACLLGLSKSDNFSKAFSWLDYAMVSTSRAFEVVGYALSPSIEGLSREQLPPPVQGQTVSDFSDASLY